MTEARGSIPYGPTNVCSGGEDGWGGKKEQTIVSVWRVGKINPEGDEVGLFCLGRVEAILSLGGYFLLGRLRPF